MFVIRKSERIKETLVLTDGENELYRLDVDLDPATIAANLQKSAAAISELKKKGCSAEEVHAGIDALLNIVFGDNAASVLEVYGGNREQALEDLAPFIRHVGDKVCEASRARAEAYKKQMKRRG